jgi:tetratricopeptide (TPR) repeat protein
LHTHFTTFLCFSIGTIHRKRNEIKEANDCFTKALQIKKQNYVVTHLSIAETMHELAITLSEGGKIDEAISSYESALSIYEENLGAHKITADILDSLGNIHLSILRLDTSYRYFERALVLKRMLFGDDDETVSDTLYLVGKVQGKSGDLDDALDSLKEGKFVLDSIIFLSVIC